MSVDYRPYLAATDLRTPEDVLAYQLTLLEPDPAAERTHAIIGPWTMPLADAIILTAYRLDRERRQACRRGALENWRAFVDSHGVRTGRRRKCLLSLVPFTAYREACAQELRIPSRAYRDWALAFSAAARAR